MQTCSPSVLSHSPLSCPYTPFSSISLGPLWALAGALKEISLPRASLLQAKQPCRTLHLALMDFVRVTHSHFSGLSRSCWIPSLPSSVSHSLVSWSFLRAASTLLFITNSDGNHSSNPEELCPSLTCSRAQFTLSLPEKWKPLWEDNHLPLYELCAQVCIIDLRTKIALKCRVADSSVCTEHWGIHSSDSIMSPPQFLWANPCLFPFSETIPIYFRSRQWWFHEKNPSDPSLSSCWQKMCLAAPEEQQDGEVMLSISISSGRVWSPSSAFPKAFLHRIYGWSAIQAQAGHAAGFCILWQGQADKLSW